MDDLIKSHMGLVGKHAKSALRKYDFDVDDYDDIFQIGCIGLIKACRRSDGRNFASYASKYINGEIAHYFRSLAGRKEYGYSGRKPHYEALSIHAFDSEDALFLDSVKILDNEEYEIVKQVWLSKWEENLLQRQCVELVVIKGLKQAAVAEILGFSPMHISRSFRKGLNLLKDAYKKTTRRTEVSIF